MTEKIEQIIESCLLFCNEKSQGCKSISFYFSRFQKEEGIKRVSELDRIVYLRMYNEEPTSSKLLKVRYWRCGYHLPASRREMIRLGQALRLSAEEIDILLTNRLREEKLSAGELNGAEKKVDESASKKALENRLKNIFDLPVPRKEDINYKNWVLLTLCYRYLVQLPKSRMDLLKIAPGKQFGQLRHILYTDLLDCIWQENKQLVNYYQIHTYSLDFSSEINRYFKPGEKISRISLIRLLLIFTIPDTNVALVNDLLDIFGFAPLSADICTPSGVSQDLLLIKVLELFTTMKSGNFEKDRELIKQMLLLCDQNICNRLAKCRKIKKGTVAYKKQQQLKDLRIMAPFSLRKENF